MFDKGSAKALYNSLTIAFLAQDLFGAILGVFSAYVIARGKFRGRAILEGISIAGFTLPGTVMGVGYLLTFNKPPLWLTGTMIILVINCIFRHLAVGVEAGITKLQQLSIEVEEASSNLGASACPRHSEESSCQSSFPAFLYGFMYVFMTTMVSISSLIFLVSPGFSLASIYIFDSASWGHIGMASAVTFKLIAVVAVCLGIIQYLSKWTGMNALRRKD